MKKIANMTNAEIEHELDSTDWPSKHGSLVAIYDDTSDDDKKLVHRYHELKLAMRERLQDPEAKERLERVMERFTVKVTKRPKEGKPYSYQCIPFGSPTHGGMVSALSAGEAEIFIALYRTGRDGLPLELHLVDRNGDWAGPGVDIQRGDVDWFGRGDQFTVKPATVGASSSRLDTTAHGRAQAAMIELACDIADIYTALDEPVLNHKRDRLVKHARELDERHATEQALRNRKIELLRKEVGQQVRITMADRKTPVVGKFDATEDDRFHQFAVKTNYDATVVIAIENIQLVEVKTERGRFEIWGNQTTLDQRL